MKAAVAAGSSAIARAKPRREAGGFSTLYKKELADHFHSARFKLVFALLILTSLASPVWRAEQHFRRDVLQQRVSVPGAVHRQRQFHPLLRLVPGVSGPAGRVGHGL